MLSKLYEDEPSHFEINRRKYFNVETNERLNKAFDQKINSFLNIVNEEKAQAIALSDRLKTVNICNENTADKNCTEAKQNENNNNFNDKKLDSLINSLKEESNYNKILNEKLKNLLKD